MFALVGSGVPYDDPLEGIAMKFFRFCLDHAWLSQEFLTLFYFILFLFTLKVNQFHRRSNFHLYTLYAYASDANQVKLQTKLVSVPRPANRHVYCKAQKCLITCSHLCIDQTADGVDPGTYSLQ